jgi:hypothetical protein
MKKFKCLSWLYIVRTWLFMPGEIVELTPVEINRYAAQIEPTEESADGKYLVRQGFYLNLIRTYLLQPEEIAELTAEEAIRYSDRIEEVVEVNA